MTDRAPSIFLIGLRASGKTTVAKAVAQALACEFVDLDVSTARELQSESAGHALQAKGEPEFRRAELAALRRVIDENRKAGPDDPRRIIALGGGTPMVDRAREVLHEELRARRAEVIYLRASPITLRVRLAKSDLSKRPSLTGAGVLEEVEALYAARDPIYRSLATHTIDVDGMNERTAIEAVLDCIRHP